jgi:hypothetical protein
MVRDVPHLALIPLFILWFGIDERVKVYLVALGVFFPIYLNTYHGAPTVDAGLIEMGRVYGLTHRGKAECAIDARNQIFRPAHAVVLPGVIHGFAATASARCTASLKSWMSRHRGNVAGASWTSLSKRLSTADRRHGLKPVRETSPTPWDWALPLTT